jgi:hypothetical protein
MSVLMRLFLHGFFLNSDMNIGYQWPALKIKQTAHRIELKHQTVTKPPSNLSSSPTISKTDKTIKQSKESRKLSPKPPQLSQSNRPRIHKLTKLSPKPPNCLYQAVQGSTNRQNYLQNRLNCLYQGIHKPTKLSPKPPPTASIKQSKDPQTDKTISKTAPTVSIKPLKESTNRENNLQNRPQLTQSNR